MLINLQAQLLHNDLSPLKLFHDNHCKRAHVVLVQCKDWKLSKHLFSELISHFVQGARISFVFQKARQDLRSILVNLMRLGILNIFVGLLNSFARLCDRVSAR